MKVNLEIFSSWDAKALQDEKKKLKYCIWNEDAQKYQHSVAMIDAMSYKA